MDITMYNVYHGDCFCIDDDSDHLVVDFGIDKGSTLPGLLTCEDICQSILEDFKQFENLDILVTHFHEDHIYGLIYMMKAYTAPAMFRTLYIPDIFSGRISTKAIPLLLLEELLSEYYLEKGKCNLCQFCKAICGSVDHICLLKRGMLFCQHKYKALWPDVDFLENEYDKLIKEFSLEQKEFYQELVRIAADLTSIVRSQVGENWRQREIHGQHLIYLESQLRELYEKIDLTPKEREKIKANGIGNWASIVFHNTMDGEENLLFTGDLDKRFLQKIVDAKDIPLHQQYRYIKLPHHGTKTHYIDFYRYNPAVFMVPNGKCKNVGNISSLYLSSINYPKVKRPYMYCANCNCCEVWDPVKKCKCMPNRKIIYSSRKKLVHT